ncbi:MAG: hypothetical protein ACI3YD_01285, partial [Alloprevotella sp.]
KNNSALRKNNSALRKNNSALRRNRHGMSEKWSCLFVENNRQLGRLLRPCMKKRGWGLAQSQFLSTFAQQSG